MILLPGEEFSYNQTVGKRTKENGFGSATTVSCYVMAKNMGHEGVLTSTVVMLTTLISGFSITMWLYILKTLQFL